MADYSTTAGRISILFAGGCWAWHRLSNGIRYVSVTLEPRKSLSSVERIFIVALAIIYSMADYSTTAGRILMLFAGGCWAWRQPSNGIRYFSVASELMNSLSSVQGVLGIKLAIFYSMADYSTTAPRILMLFAGGCWPWHRLYNDIRYFPRDVSSWCYMTEWCAGDPRTRWQIPPQPLGRFWIWLRGIVGLDASYTAV